MTVWIVMYQVGWDGLENLERVFSTEEKAEEYVSQQRNPRQYLINEHDID